LELYNTDGATGAARGAGIGAGIYKNFSEAYSSMKKIKSFEPSGTESEKYLTVYNEWKKQLKNL
jgi:xylulokinase